MWHTNKNGPLDYRYFFRDSFARAYEYHMHHALEAPRVIRWPVALGVWAHRHPGHVDLDVAVLWMPRMI